MPKSPPEPWPDVTTILPHRYPFLLVDEIVEVEDGRRAVGIKNVSANEPYFAGHFPGQPVMPGVLICEAMAQVGGMLAYRSQDGVEGRKAMALAALDRVRFRRPVVPGDQLRVEVTALARRARAWKMRGIVSVGERVVAEAELTTMEVDGEGLPRTESRRIHPTAVVAPGAELGPGVEVGPYAVIGAQVQIGSGSVVGPHAVIEGRTAIGERNRILQFASIGALPQDLKYRGEPSRLEIGAGNVFREFTSISPGTEVGGMVTRIGDGNLFMVNAHVAHDCHVGNRTILANAASLGGCVVVEDHVIVGGLAGVHQFVRLGESAILGAGTMASMDVPPFCTVAGDRARLHGLNVVGLRRRGFSSERVLRLKRAYRILFQSRLKMRAAIDRARTELGGDDAVDHLLGFIEASSRGICRAKGRSTH
jgi:UDP-N-acetylglucosamine acyltransferase